MQSVKNVMTLIKQYDLDVRAKEIIQQAFFHSSYANEVKNTQESNERLEFLGDGVLNLIIAKYLYQKYPKDLEGVLTKKRAQLVREESLVVYSQAIKLADYLYLGKGEEKTGGRQRAAIVADAFEAFIGAIFITHGFDKAETVLLSIFIPVYEGGKIIIEQVTDYKSLFQEQIQIDPDRKIVYEVIAENGPPHNRMYDVSVLVDDIIYGTGSGKTKKDAEQKAALAALDKLAPAKTTNA